MKIKFDGWSEKAWFPAGPDLECEEDYPGAKKSDGGRAFSSRGRVFVSRGARWRRALYWHERGHCLLFEAGRHRRVVASLQEEIDADEVAELMAGTRQVLGMLLMLLRRCPSRYVREVERRIEAVVSRNPAKAIGILEKMPPSIWLADVLDKIKEKDYDGLLRGKEAERGEVRHDVHGDGTDPAG